jgi:hypothetical protein
MQRRNAGALSLEYEETSAGTCFGEVISLFDLCRLRRKRSKRLVRAGGPLTTNPARHRFHNSILLFKNTKPAQVIVQTFLERNRQCR